VLDTRRNGAVPFWFWNGDQQEAEITRQLELAAANGLRGMAIHARHGNQTEYMSDRWLELVRHSCVEAIRLGLDIWLYDEEGYPSGTVGHRLQKDDPSLQQKQLVYDYVQGHALAEVDDLAYVYDAETLDRVDPDGVAADQDVLAFWIRHTPRYIDALKREASERFLDMTHRKYHDALGEFFGKPITHVYTDDLNSFLKSDPSLPYTDDLFEQFQACCGYDLAAELPKLVENVPGCEAVRFDFRRLVLDLFLDRYVTPMYAWCEEHGLVFPGHLSGDEGEIDKAACRFGSAMAFYEREHVPGIDDFLCDVPDGRYLADIRNHRNHCPAVLFKQVSSVANQLKGGACGCEVLTFLGWGAPVWAQAAFLNYELALGVNLMTHHDFSYATGGVAKRDCPPSYFFQQPYWPHYGAFHDAVARSTQLLTRGQYDASVLVVHPMTSCWVGLDGDGSSLAVDFPVRRPNPYPNVRTLEDRLAEVSHELLRARVGFEYGDESILAEHGSVSNGELRVGDMHYDTVIVPPVWNLTEPVVDLLEWFGACGGRLVVIDPPDACLVDGRTPERPVFGGADPRLTPSDVLSDPSGIRDLRLEPSVALDVAEADAPVICHTRVVDGRREHFVHNVSERAQTVAWADADLRAYDPVGNHWLETTEGRLSLPPFHAVHLLPRETALDVPNVPRARTLFAESGGEAMAEIPTESWSVSRDGMNLMLVDWCELPDGRQVLHTDRDAAPEDCESLTVRIHVLDPERFEGLVCEASLLDGLRINGSPVDREPTGAHPASQDMPIVDVADLLREGSNEFTFRRLRGDVLFEPLYLAGDFAVRLIETEHGMRPELAVEPLSLGDAAEQGLPFYWGSVTYRATWQADEGERTPQWLDCGDAGAIVTLRLNGQDVGSRYAAPYRFHVGDAWRDGPNEIAITLWNTAQNLFGPHRRSGMPFTPTQRRGSGRGDYYLCPFGIHGPVTLR